MKGPARDAYANCFYTIPLYLALWYSFVATLLPAHVTFLVLVAVLFISRPEYWFTENIFLGPGPSFLNILLGLGWQFLVGAFTLFVWTAATLYMRVEVEVGRAHPSRLVVFEEGPALALTCILVIKVINTWKRSRFIWSNLIVSPYHEYWEPSATKEEINIWERLEWQQLQDRQRRREWDSLATEEEILDHNMREVMEYNESRRRRKEPKERFGKHLYIDITRNPPSLRRCIEVLSRMKMMERPSTEEKTTVRTSFSRPVPRLMIFHDSNCPS
jgi:hypothetical protein